MIHQPEGASPRFNSLALEPDASALRLIITLSMDAFQNRLNGTSQLDSQEFRLINAEPALV
jgi:hypothetical protein